MKWLLLTSLLVTGSVLASDIDADVHDASTRAVKFNKWYISQIINDVYPITDVKLLKPYIDAETLKILETSYLNDSEESGSDYFLKVQNFEDDNWKNNVSVQLAYPDPICMNVYLTLGTGKDAKHIIDCMVKEQGVWKVKYVTDPNPV